MHNQENKKKIFYIHQVDAIPERVESMIILARRGNRASRTWELFKLFPWH